jgi:uncharacterized membrane protein
MAVFYTLAGINHFIHPDIYYDIIPPWLPYPMELVYISGGAEIAAGLLLLLPYTRRIGAWFIIALLLAVFPANVQMTINYFHEGQPMFWLTLVRLPLQFVLIWWAWKFTK